MKFYNPTPTELKFRIGSENYCVQPEGEVEIPDRYAYAVSGMGLPLITVDEFLSRSTQREFAERARIAKERVEQASAEAVQAANAAANALNRGDPNAEQLAAISKEKVVQAAVARTEADDAAIALIQLDPQEAAAPWIPDVPLPAIPTLPTLESLPADAPVRAKSDPPPAPKPDPKPLAKAQPQPNKR